MSGCKQHKNSTTQSFHNRSISTVHPMKKMIQMLKNYQDSCLRKGNFIEAEASKIRIQQLKQQQLKSQHEELIVRNKQNVEEVDRRNQKEIAIFNLTWQERTKKHLQNYKELQQKLKYQHEQELEEVEKRMSVEQPPKIKYSATVLKMRSHLQNLIKSRIYLQAEYVSQQLQTLEQQENVLWIQKFQEKKRKQFEQVIKKQQIQTKALKVKIKTMFNQTVKQKEEAFNKLLNKIQKRKVNSSKCPIQIKLKQQKINRNRSVHERSISQQKSHKSSLMESQTKLFR